MMNKLDMLLDRITMYRLVLYVLIALIGVAALLAYFHLLHFSPLSLLLSAVFLVVLCWATNTICAFLLKVPSNLESTFITALILALMLDPARSLGDVRFLGWVAVLAMASKYLLAIRKHHLFNPAAVAVVITAVAMGGTASWWIGTTSMLPAVLIGGWLIVHKLRQEEMIVLFCGAALASTCLLTLIQGRTLSTEILQLLLQSPLFFFAALLLTEPLTAPPTKHLRRIYGILIGIVFVPLVHIGPVYSTPELALVVSNLFSYIVSPKQKVLLRLQKKLKVAPNILHFVFKPSRPLVFTPGQYLEVTLAHPHPDSRGIRRYFTLASSPTESTVHLGVRFYEQGSSFKQAMYWMNTKTALVGAQVAGDFSLPSNPEQKLVFLAGGVGITPFRSMLKYLLDTQQQRDIHLLYVNKTAQEIAYKDILQEASLKVGVKIVYTLTDTAAVPRKWPGLVGRISEQMIRQTVPDYQERLYYLSGSPEMVRASERVLKNLHIKERQIKKDFFPGLV